MELQIEGLDVGLLLNTCFCKLSLFTCQVFGNKTLVYSSTFRTSDILNGFLIICTFYGKYIELSNYNRLLNVSRPVRGYTVSTNSYAIPQLSDELVALRQVQELEEFEAAVLDLAPAHPEHPAVEVERLRDRHVLVDGQTLRQIGQGFSGSFMQHTQTTRTLAVVSGSLDSRFKHLSS